jgi:hypothetical protein
MQATTTPATLSIAPVITIADLRAIVDQLRTEHPQAGPRLDHAAFIATIREVERGTSSGLWWVQSETDPNQTYMVIAGERCCCQDFARRGALTPCKHLLAVELHQRAERLEAEALDPTPPLAWELTAAAIAALDALGEHPDLAPQCSRCQSEPALPSHRAGLGQACLRRELYGEDSPDVA